MHTTLALITFRKYWGPVQRGGMPCHRCSPDSMPGAGMWQGSGHTSRVGAVLVIIRFSPPPMSIKLQKPCLP